MTDTATELEAMLAAARYKDHECSWKAIPMEPCHVCDATALAQLRLEGCTPELARCAIALTLLLERIEEGHLVAPREYAVAARQSEGEARQAFDTLDAAMEAQRRG